MNPQCVVLTRLVVVLAMFIPGACGGRPMPSAPQGARTAEGTAAPGDPPSRTSSADATKEVTIRTATFALG
jgi:hypothetical protein